jgi:His/Glu/Gln/Arg/opine family amino acid ABC transporter permease subunit
MIQGYEIDLSSPGAFAISILPILLIGLRTTVLAMVVGFAIAVVAGLVFALLRKSSWRVVSWGTALVIEFLRNTPLLMQLFFLYFVLPEYGIVLPAFWTGTIALGLHQRSLPRRPRRHSKRPVGSSHGAEPHQSAHLSGGRHPADDPAHPSSAR